MPPTKQNGLSYDGKETINDFYKKSTHKRQMEGGYDVSSPSKRDGRTRDGDAGGRSQVNNTTVMPVTVKMCLEAKKAMPHSVFTIDDQDIVLVCFVKLVTSIH